MSNKSHHDRIIAIIATVLHYVCYLENHALFLFSLYFLLLYSRYKIASFTLHFVCHVHQSTLNIRCMACMAQSRHEQTNDNENQLGKERSCLCTL